ncbi:MAG: flagellar basal body-associated FliL family protein [Treponema sp.]|jgi:flagellar FliL protein|nr:flagellar basal body-associated FliL family protein [Treponema sp.]
MANEADEKIDLGGDEEGGDAGSKKKKGNAALLAALLPNLLKFVAIGLGMLILIVTISVITFNILNKGGTSQTIVTDDDAYVGTRPQYSMFSALPVIRAMTKDPSPYSVVVELVLGYDLNNATAATELTSRLVELQDFVRNYFSSKYNADLQPDKEEQLKQDLIEKLNRRLNTAKVRAVFFKQLSTMEM